MGMSKLIPILLVDIVGAWSDRIHTRFGQRLPFMMLGMPLVAVFFMLLPFGANELWSLIALDMLFILAVSINQAPVISLMPDHTPTDKRSTANGIIF